MNEEILWVPFMERLPEKQGRYLVLIRRHGVVKETAIVEYDLKLGFLAAGNILFWAELPQGPVWKEK